MRKLFTKTRPPTPVEPKPMVGTRSHDEQTDLTCSVCSHVIAYGVRPERVAADADFYLDAHKPFCIGMSAAS